MLRMETDARTNFVARLAERGLSLKSFNGETLTLHYDAEKDTEVEQGHAVDLESVTRHGRDALAQLPGSEAMFPHLQRIEVEVSATE